MTIEEAAARLNDLRWADDDDGVNCTGCEVDPCPHFLEAVRPVLSAFAEGAMSEERERCAQTAETSIARDRQTYVLMGALSVPCLRRDIAASIRALSTAKAVSRG